MRFILDKFMNQFVFRFIFCGKIRNFQNTLNPWKQCQSKIVSEQLCHFWVWISETLYHGSLNWFLLKSILTPWDFFREFKIILILKTEVTIENCAPESFKNKWTVLKQNKNEIGPIEPNTKRQLVTWKFRLFKVVFFYSYWPKKTMQTVCSTTLSFTFFRYWIPMATNTVTLL